MILELINIGNSKGFRIPKPLLTEINIVDKAEVHVSGNKIIIEAAKDKPRKDWEAKFKKHARSEQIEFMQNEWDDSEWTW